jgi:hypothetical protein
MVNGQDILNRWQRRSLMAACAAVVVCVAMLWGNTDRLWQSFLFGFLACWLLSMGGMGLLALGNLTGGRWATVCRPFYLAATQTVPLVALLFAPVGLFAEHIYPWAATPGIELPPAQAVYLETGFFILRAAAYILVWLVLCGLLSVVSRLDMPPASTPAMRRVGAITLVLLVPTATFAAFDWSMSLEPAWYSSIYGALLSACGVLAAHALAVCAAVSCGDDAVANILLHSGNHAYTDDVHELQSGGQQALRAENGSGLNDHGAEIWNDLGNLLLAFLMVTAYFALSQFLIIWSGNLPSEITWYLRRLNGGWEWVALALVLFGFLAPFLTLLSREWKRSPRSVRRIALVVFGMYFVHLYWMVVPAFGPASLASHVLNVAVLVALFGVWLAAFAWRAKRCLGFQQVYDLPMPE